MSVGSSEVAELFHTTFSSLTDTPSSMTPLHHVRANASGDALEFVALTPGITDWVGLSDTPGSITASRPVVGNPGGTALEFGGNALTDYLRRDGSNTITGDIAPDGAATRSFGSFANQFARMDSEKLAVGYKTGSTTVDFLPLYAGPVGGVVGFGSMKGPGTGRIRVGGYYYAPVATFGNIFTDSADQTAEIINYGGGSFVTGSAFATGNTSVARLYMNAYSYGSFLGGYAFTPGADSTALVRNFGPGSFVWGYSSAGANSTLTIESGSGAFGSFTAGRADGTGATHILTSTGVGAFTGGQVTGNNTAHVLSASGQGSFAQGRCLGNTPNAQILATNQGSFAQGRAANYATITSSGRGSFAQGNCQNTGAYITASGNGSLARGQAINSSGVLASGTGGFAAGAALGGNNVTASGSGSFAFGDSTAGAITASMTNAVQFGVGVNATADSLQVGSEVQFFGSIGRLRFTGILETDPITITGTTHTAGDEHVILVDDDTAGSTVTVTLPLANAADAIYHIKKLGTTANVVVDGNGTETIDGQLTQTISIQYDSIMVVSDGSNWHII